MWRHNCGMTNGVRFLADAIGSQSDDDRITDFCHKLIRIFETSSPRDAEFDSPPYATAVGTPSFEMVQRMEEAQRQPKSREALLEYTLRQIDELDERWAAAVRSYATLRLD